MDYKSYTYRDCLYTIINHQQELIERYEEYIENNIHRPIQKYSKEDFDRAANEYIRLQRITIPQADIVMRCDYQVAREYDMIKAEFPIFPLELIKQFVEDKLMKGAD